MDLATAILRWIDHHLPPLWLVIVIALVLARLDHANKLRRMDQQDAWWLRNLRRSDTKLLHRRRWSR